MPYRWVNCYVLSVLVIVIWVGLGENWGAKECLVNNQQMGEHTASKWPFTISDTSNTWLCSQPVEHKWRHHWSEETGRHSSDVNPCAIPCTCHDVMIMTSNQWRMCMLCSLHAESLTSEFYFHRLYSIHCICVHSTSFVTLPVLTELFGQNIA